MKRPRLCIVCGAIFRPQRRTRVYCSARCRMREARRRWRQREGRPLPRPRGRAVRAEARAPAPTHPQPPSGRPVAEGRSSIYRCCGEPMLVLWSPGGRPALLCDVCGARRPLPW